MTLIASILTFINRRLRNMLADPVRGLEFSLLMLLALVGTGHDGLHADRKHVARWMRST